MHDDPNGSAAARSQVRLAVEEEKDDFSGARSELHQRVPAHLESVGLQPFYQLELLRHGPGLGKIRDHRERRDGQEQHGEEEVGEESHGEEKEKPGLIRTRNTVHGLVFIVAERAMRGCCQR